MLSKVGVCPLSIELLSMIFETSSEITLRPSLQLPGVHMQLCAL